MLSYQRVSQTNVSTIIPTSFLDFVVTIEKTLLLRSTLVLCIRLNYNLRNNIVVIVMIGSCIMPVI